MMATISEDKYTPSMVVSYSRQLVQPLSIATTKSTKLVEKHQQQRTFRSSSFLISDILEKTDMETINKQQQHADLACKIFINGQCSPSEKDSTLTSPSGRSSVGGASSPNNSRKPRKSRTIFTDKQLQTLEQSFEKQKYLSVQDRLELAQRMNLSDTQVKTWYQNRRTKWKRQTAVGLELLTEAGNISAVQRLLQTNPYWGTYLAAHMQQNSHHRPAVSGTSSDGQFSPGTESRTTTTNVAAAAANLLPNILGFPSVRCR